MPPFAFPPTALALALVWVGDPAFDDREHAVTIARLREVGLALHEGLEAKGVALPVGKPIPLPDLAPVLGRKHRKRLSTADAWGRPLYVVQTSRQIAIGSMGPDGRADLDLHGFDAPGAIVQDIIAPEADDLVWIDAIVVANDADAEQARKRRTAWRLTYIAQWLELHYVRGGRYPGVGRGAIEIPELVWLLEAEGHGVALPRVDAWGHAITYASDGRRFLLVSRGPGASAADDVTLDGPSFTFTPG